MFAVLRKLKNLATVRELADGNWVDKVLHNWRAIFFWFMVFVLWLYGVTNR